MYRLSLVISLLIYWISNPALSFGQVSGADISYSFPSFDRLHVKVVVYHSCTPLKLNDTLYVETLDKNSSSTTDHFLPIKTHIDSSFQKHCGKPCGWNGRKTILDYEFPIDYWLNNNIDSIRMSSCPGVRPKGFTFIPNANGAILKVSASIFRLRNQNSSYEFALLPPFYSVKDQDFMVSPGLFHGDQGLNIYDSVICEAVPPINETGQQLTYVANYSETKPFAFSTISQLRNSFVAPHTGDHRFKPSQTGLSIIKTRVFEFQNGQEIGYIEREQLIEIISSSSARSHILKGQGNTSPFNIENFNLNICEGDTVQFFTVVTEGNVNDTDSVIVTTPYKWLTSKTKFSDTVNFNIPFNTARINPQPYRLFLSTFSDRCENGTQGSATFLMHFKKSPKPDYKIDLNQNVAVFKATDTSTLKSTNFQWKFEKKVIKTDSFLTRLKYPGRYPYQLELMATNGCVSTVHDTIQTSQFPFLTISLDNSTQCEGEVLVNVQIENSLEQPQLQWSNGLVGNANVIVLDQDTVVGISALFSNGFENSDTFRLRVIPKPFIKIETDSIHCAGNSARVHLSQTMLPQDSFVDLFWQISDSIRVSHEDTIWVRGEKVVALTAQGENGCSSTDSLHIAFNKTPNLPPLTKRVCLNDSVELGLEGEWNWNLEWLNLRRDTISTDSTLWVKAINDTLILARLHDKLDGTTCSWLDTFRIKTIPLPKIDRLKIPSQCSNGAPLFLNDSAFVNPVGGRFSLEGEDDFLKNSFLYPNQLATNNQLVHYFYTDTITGCIGTTSDSIKIHLAPKIKFTSQNLEPCVGAKRILLTSKASPLGGDWTGTGVVFSNDSFFYTPPVNSVVSDSIYYTFNDGKCESSEALFINVSLHARPWFSTQSTIDGVDIVFRDSTACNATSRKWHFLKLRKDGKDSIRTEKSIRLNYKDPGFYPVFLVVEDAGRSIRDTSDTFVMRIVPNTVEEVSTWFSVFPSPSNQVLYYKSDFDVNELNLFSIEGRQNVQIQINNSREGSINTSLLPSGIYVLRINTKQGTFYYKHLVQH